MTQPKLPLVLVLLCWLAASASAARLLQQQQQAGGSWQSQAAMPPTTPRLVLQTLMDGVTPAKWAGAGPWALETLTSLAQENPSFRGLHLGPHTRTAVEKLRNSIAVRKFLGEEPLPATSQRALERFQKDLWARVRDVKGATSFWKPMPRPVKTLEEDNRVAAIVKGAPDGKLYQLVEGSAEAPTSNVAEEVDRVAAIVKGAPDGKLYKLVAIPETAQAEEEAGSAQGPEEGPAEATLSLPALLRDASAEAPTFEGAEEKVQSFSATG